MKREVLKKIKKSKIASILMLFAILLNIFSPFANASISMSGVEVHCNNSKAPFYMWYTNYQTHAYFVTYTDQRNGNEYPAYCINRELPGADPDNSYTVDVDSLYSNNKVWRVLKNGYPYSSISSMGLTDKYEAFYVTKQAIYCVLGQTEFSNYSAVDGYEYVYEAFVKLVNEGLYGTETYKSASVNIAKSGSGATSTINGNSYYVQKYEVTSSLEFANFDVEISGFPSGTLILNSKNESQTSYTGATTFKVAIPTTKITSDIKGLVKVNNVQVKTYPVLYAKTRTAGTQDYAMVTDPYETTDSQASLSATIPNITLIKKDISTGENVPNATYAIYLDVNENGKYDSGDTLVKSVKTGSDGTVSISGLTPGKYIAVETKAPTGYNLDSVDQAFTVSIGGSDVTITSNDSPVVKIVKKDRDTGKTLAGAVYKIYKDLNENGVYDKGTDTLVYTTPKTDSNGETTVCSLDKGKYIAIESVAPTGYNLDSKEQAFSITAGGKAITIQSTDTIAPTIVKKDRDSGKVLADAVYEIYNDVNKNGIIDNKDTLVYTTVATDKNGTTKVCGLEIGQYISREIQAPTGYNLDDKDNVFTISTTNKAVTIQSTNTLAPTIVKTDRDTTKVLEGAIYEIYEDVNKNGVIDKGDKLIFTTKPTDKLGTTKVCILSTGQYITKEIQAPIGYNLNDRNNIFTITTNGTTVTVQSTDTISPTIVKTDRDTGGKLTGAVYEIYQDINGDGIIDEEDKLVYTTEPTSDKGTTKVCGLPVGQFISREVKAPEGYNLNSEDTVFVITTDDKAVIIESTDTIAPTILKTDRDTGDKLPGAVYEIYKDTNENNVIDEEDELVYTTEPTSDKGTTKVCGLPVGQFISREVKAPEGYNLNSEDTVFVITTDDKAVTIESTDTLAPTIIKKNRDLGDTLPNATEENEEAELIDDETVDKTIEDTYTYLQGAVYEIYRDTNENKVIDEGDELVYTTEPTSEDGTTKVCGLPVGQFISREVKAPEGYNLNSEDTVFVITTDDEAVIIESTDTIAPTIVKTDRDTQKHLAGAVYEIYKDTNENKVIDEGDELVYTTEPTSEDGTTKVCGLPVGQFISREIKAPEGYNLDDEDTVFVITTDDKAVIIESTDTVSPTIIKTERNTEYTRPNATEENEEAELIDDETVDKTIEDTYTYLPGAVYEIYRDTNENKVIDEGDELVYTTEPTNEKGETKVCGLPVGQFITKEMQAPEGYNLDDENHIFEILYDGSAITINSSDTVITSTVKINKVAENDNEITGDKAGDGLEGAIYNIYDINHKLLYENVKTDKEGIANVVLRYGKYIVEEVRPPEYYLLNPNDETNSQVISVYKQGELISLEFQDEAVAVGLVIEKTGIVQCQPNDEILYKFPQLKNDSNVALDDFTWTDVLPTEYIRATKLYTGTYSQDLNYTIWYKTNLSKDYIQYVNINSEDGTYNTLKNNYIDFAKLNTEEEYVTEWKLEFGTVEPKFTAKEKPFMFAKVNDTIEDNDMWTNNTYLTGNYTSIDGNTISLASKDDWTTTSYKFNLKIKKLPKTGE